MRPITIEAVIHLGVRRLRPDRRSVGTELQAIGPSGIRETLGTTLRGVVIPRTTKRLHRGRSASTAPAGSVELLWLQEEVNQSHLVLDGYGVPRTSGGTGSNGNSVTLTLAGRLRLMLDEPPRRARHVASNREGVTRQEPPVNGGAAQGD